jgi:hypothetical protein
VRISVVLAATCPYQHLVAFSVGWGCTRCFERF